MTSGSSGPGQLDGLGAVAGLAEHLEARVAGEHAAQAVADDRVVVDDQQPDRRAQALGAPGGRGHGGDAAEIAVPPPGSDSISSVPARPAHPLPHRRQAEAAAVARARWPAVEADAVVADVEGRPRPPCTTGSARPGSRRRAWRRWPGPPARCAAASPRPPGASAAAVAGGGESTRRPRAAPTSARRRPAIASGSRAPASGSGRSAWTRPAGLGEALPGQVGRGRRRAAAVGAGSTTRLLGGLELGDDAGQALGEGVVDLPRHALALVEHARLAGLDEQLRLQAGVLGQRSPPAASPSACVRRCVRR